MIHETLLYLLNCPGDVLKTYGEEEMLDVLGLEDFIHPSEKKLLQRILAVGTSYHRIENFIKTVNEENNINFDVQARRDSLVKYEDKDKSITQITKPGLYIKAFCEGLDECLKDYRIEIVQLEEKFLKNSSINLTYILSCVEKYVILFESLKSMICMIQNEKIWGCQIIGKLRRYLECGAESVVDATRKIIHSVNVVFFHQLCNWIIYGELVDLYDEFFICDGKDSDENFLYNEQLHETSKGSDSTFNSFKKNELKKPLPIRRFYLKEELFPFNNATYLAEVILFIGQIVWIVHNDPKEKTKTKFHFRYKRNVWEGKDVEFYRKIQSLGNKAFSMSEFEETIEECRLKHLWFIMVEEANLLEHFQLVRDYYGLGRGELFQQFIISVENQMKENSFESTLNNLNYIFKETARNMYGENDKTHQKFEIRLTKFHDKKDVDPWSYLEINFEVEWPLHIIFHPKALNLYNKLFCYLLRIKKTHIDLHRLWLLHTQGKKKINPMVWTLRNTLMFIVNNIQYYLQVDVIEAEFSLLKESFKNANEFGDITRHHSRFLTSLLSKTFILSLDEDINKQSKEKYTLYQAPSLIFGEGENLVYRVILQILQLCNKFCLSVSIWDDDLTETEKQLQEMKAETDTLIHFLLRGLYDLHEQRVLDQHLLQLLCKLDFNGWFSKKKELNLEISVTENVP